jgi:hypothetical protein
MTQPRAGVKENVRGKTAQEPTYLYQYEARTERL